MKYGFLFLSIIFLLAGCRTEPAEDNYVVLSVNGKEYKWTINYGEKLLQPNICNLAFFEDESHEVVEMQLYITFGMHGDGAYHSAEVTKNFWQLKRDAEKDKIVILAIGIANKNPKIDGNYYANKGIFEIKEKEGFYEINTPAPISLRDEENSSRSATLKLKITHVPIKQVGWSDPE